jgi:vesicle coat complex subunit
MFTHLKTTVSPLFALTRCEKHGRSLMEGSICYKCWNEDLVHHIDNLNSQMDGSEYVKKAIELDGCKRALWSIGEVLNETELTKKEKLKLIREILEKVKYDE